MHTSQIEDLLESVNFLQAELDRRNGGSTQPPNVDDDYNDMPYEDKSYDESYDPSDDGYHNDFYDDGGYSYDDEGE